MCGVEFESLESVFLEFDSHCDFIVYPKHKSYSFVVLSDIDKAINAQSKLDDTTPIGFPKEIAVFYVTNCIINILLCIKNDFLSTKR